MIGKNHTFSHHNMSLAIVTTDRNINMAAFINMKFTIEIEQRDRPIAIALYGQARPEEGNSRMSKIAYGLPPP